MSAIAVQSLSRDFAGSSGAATVSALCDISFELPAHQICGLLGPNGAGKTTLVRILTTALLPTSGTARVAGLDVVSDTALVRRKIGVVLGGERGLYGRLTGFQNLEYWGALYDQPVRRSRELANGLLRRLGLAEKANTLVEHYSRGMKQRLHIARGLMGDPEVLFLDEPTIGMDPVAARTFRELVRELRSEGRTIFLTTHDMAEAQSVCDNVALIDRGRLLALDTPDALTRDLAQASYVDIEIETTDSSLVDQIRALTIVAGIDGIGASQSIYRVRVHDPSQTCDLLGLLAARGICSMRTVKPTLEDVYLSTFGAPLPQATTSRHST
jgi:ABC-2 type transport system ATP-binding protein